MNRIIATVSKRRRTAAGSAASIMLLVMLALSLPAARNVAASGVPDPPESGLYDFGGASAAALSLYRRGWIEILRYGRWTEAERLYREAVAMDPDLSIAKSVLARITRDPAERDLLYRSVRDSLADVDEHGRLLLATYQATLELFARREAGEAIPGDFRTAMARQAVRDYGAFLRAYPNEWSVLIEYVEWVHALDGPAAALDAVDRLHREGGHSFSYFPAWFHAELGNRVRARDLARRFSQSIDDPTSPQPHYLHAFLAYQEGELEEAREAVSIALKLDARHLLADRLRREIEAAGAE